MLNLKLSNVCRKICVLTLLVLSGTSLKAQVRMNASKPVSQQYLESNIRKSTNLLSKDKIDTRIIIADTGAFWKSYHGNRERVAAIKAFTDLNLANSGTWENIENGRLWRLRISSPGATTLSFIFGQFYIPEKASLSIYDLNQSQVMGPFTSLNNRTSRTYATHILYGNEVILEYFEPFSVNGQGKIAIKSVGYGVDGQAPQETQFKRKWGASFLVEDDKPCTKNANCPEGDDLEKLKRAVCYIITEFTNHLEKCTGTLINNGAQDCRPLILTAGHTIPSDSTDSTDIMRLENATFRFNFLRRDCPSSSTVDTSKVIDYTGANLVVNYLPAYDLGMLEMQSTPAYIEYYAGWSNNADWETPDSSPPGKLLSHPSGRPMTVYVATYGSVNDQTYNWEINFGNSKFYPGSSGSPMINRNYFIQGVLVEASNAHTCGAPFSTEVGTLNKIAVPWDLLPPFPLKNVLNPGNIIPEVNGVVRVEGRERWELGCTTNKENCCKLINSSFLKKEGNAVNLGNGSYKCCNTLHLEMKEYFKEAGCDSTYKIRITVAGGDTIPYDSGVYTLPKDIEICRTIDTANNLPDSVNFKIEFIDPVTNNVISACNQTISNKCRECKCKYTVNKIIAKQSPSPKLCCYDIILENRGGCKAKSVYLYSESGTYLGISKLSDSVLTKDTISVCLDRNLLPQTLTFRFFDNAISNPQEVSEGGMCTVTAKLPKCELNCCDAYTFRWESGSDLGLGVPYGHINCLYLILNKNPLYNGILDCDLSKIEIYALNGSLLGTNNNNGQPFTYPDTIKMVCCNPNVVYTQDPVYVFKYYDIYGNPLPCSDTVKLGCGAPGHQKNEPLDIEKYKKYEDGLNIVPNPAGNEAEIIYSLTKNSTVAIKVYDNTGALVETIFEGEKMAGSHSYKLTTSTYSSGIYYIVISCSDEVKTGTLQVVH